MNRPCLSVTVKIKIHLIDVGPDGEIAIVLAIRRGLTGVAVCGTEPSAPGVEVPGLRGQEPASLSQGGRKLTAALTQTGGQPGADANS